ncbi:hypothetical protein Acidovoranil_14390 [Acidovorax sp. FG27]
MRQQRGQQLVALGAVVCAGGFEQGDGLGDGAALNGAGLAGDAVVQAVCGLCPTFDRLRLNGSGWGWFSARLAGEAVVQKVCGLSPAFTRLRLNGRGWGWGWGWG